MSRIEPTGHRLGTARVGNTDKLFEELGRFVVVPVGENDRELLVVVISMHLGFGPKDERCSKAISKPDVGVCVDPICAQLAGFIHRHNVCELLARRNAAIYVSARGNL